METEVRSADEATPQLALWPDRGGGVDESRSPSTGAHHGGVGARRRTRPVRRGGGGYLNGRTHAELRDDPRLRELQEIGLREHWIEVAQEIGYDAFLAMWRLLSKRESLRDDSNQIALTLRPFASFERYQMNRYVETLIASGLSAVQIHSDIRQNLQWPMTITQVRRRLKHYRERSKRNG